MECVSKYWQNLKNSGKNCGIRTIVFLADALFDILGDDFEKRGDDANYQDLLQWLQMN